MVQGVAGTGRTSQPLEVTPLFTLRSVALRVELHAMDAINQALASYSDPLILASGTIGAALVALVVAFVSRAFLFRRSDTGIEAHSKLAEVVHNSLLAFAVFVLALVLSEVRSNLGKADDAALREASTVTRLARELRNIGGPEAAAAGAALKAYVQSAITSEWATLGQAEPALSDETEKAMEDLIGKVHAVTLASPVASANLRRLTDSLEELRQGRLETATRSVPHVFWWVVIVFIGGAMVMNGRHKLDLFTGAMITLHMGAIGMVVALILVMDSPYRGQTSVSPNAMAKAAGLAPPR